MPAFIFWEKARGDATHANANTSPAAIIIGMMCKAAKMEAEAEAEPKVQEPVVVRVAGSM